MVEHKEEPFLLSCSIKAGETLQIGDYLDLTIEGNQTVIAKSLRTTSEMKFVELQEGGLVLVLVKTS